MNKWLWWCNSIILYSFYLLLFFVPLFFTNDTSELFEFNKMWLTFWLTIPIVTAWLCKMILQKKIIFQRTPFDIPLALFLLSQIISTVISSDPHISFWGYYSRFNGGLLSTISYLLLYYAFVSNFTAIEQQLKDNYMALSSKALLLIGGGMIYTLGLFLSPPSSATAEDGKLWLFYSLAFVSFCLFILTLSGPLMKRIFSLILITGVVVALWGLPSHFGKDPTCYLFRGTFDVACWTESFQPTIRIFSTLGQPDWMAAYLSMLLPITIAFCLLQLIKKPAGILKSKALAINPSLPYINKLLMLCFIFLALLFYLDLLFTNTRAGFIGFWIANIFFWLVLFFNRRFRRDAFFSLFIGLNLLFLLLNFFFSTPLDQLNKYTFHNFTHPTTTQPAVTTPASSSSTLQSQSQKSGITDSGTIRLYVWNGAIAAWKDHPLFGTGVETFAFTYYKYRPIGHNTTSEWDFLYNKAHNEYLNYLATTGIFGLGSYLLFILVFIYLAMIKIAHYISQDMHPGLADFIRSHLLFYKSNQEFTEEHLLLTIGLISAYITILITNFFGFSVVMLNLFLFLIPAFFFVVTSLEKPQEAMSNKNSDANAFQWTGIGMLLLVALYFELILLADWNADKAYAMGHNLDQVQQYKDAHPYLLSAVSQRPDEPVFQDELSINNADLAALYTQNKDTQDAQTYALDAKNMNDSLVTQYPNNVLFWKSRARIFYLLSQGDPRILQVALQAMQQAEQLAPTDAKILYNLGVLYGQTGDIDRGIQTLEKTVQYKPDYRDAYYALGLFYHDKATDKNGRVVDTSTQQKAVVTLQYILDHLSKDDPATIKTLTSWGAI